MSSQKLVSMVGKDDLEPNRRQAISKYHADQTVYNINYITQHTHGVTDINQTRYRQKVQGIVNPSALGELVA